MNTTDGLHFLFGALVAVVMIVLMGVALRIEHGPWVLLVLWGLYACWASKRPKRTLAWGAAGAIAVMIGLLIGITVMLIRYDLWD